MAWTAPRTWVVAETVTAAQMNTHIRDNLLETAPATATTAGDIVYADAANSMGSRVGIGSAGSLLQSNGTGLEWSAAGSAGDILTSDGTDPAWLSLGVAHGLLVSDGTDPVWRVPGSDASSDNYATNGTSGSASFIDFDNFLWGNGTGSATVDVTVTTGTAALVFFGATSALADDATVNIIMSYRVSGATTIASATARATRGTSAVASKQIPLARTYLVSTLTAGSNTFTLQAVPDASATITIYNPYIIVVPL